MRFERHAGLGILLAVALGGLALGLAINAGSAPGGVAAAPTSIEEGARVVEPIDDAPLHSVERRGVSVAEVTPAEERAEEREAAPEAVATIDGARIRAAVAELGAILERPGFERHVWERTTCAYAKLLGTGASDELVTVLAEPAREAAELAAAGELLRLVWRESSADARPALPPGADARLASALERLREDPDDSVAAASARVLAGIGREEDAMEVAGLLMFEEDPTCLEVARWALSVNTRPAVARRLADSVVERTAGPRQVLMLRVLAEMVSEGGEPLLSEPARYRVCLGVAQAIRTDDVAVGTATAVLAALEALEPTAMREVLLDCAATAAPELARHAVERLVASGDDTALDQLGTRLLVESDPERLAFTAEALVPALERDLLAPEVRALALQTLETSALLSEDAARRRRAVHGLATLDDALSAQALVRALESDEDPHVRGAAATGLGRLGDARLHLDALRRSRDQDPSPVVRRTAAFQVRRLEQPATDAP